MITAAVGEGGRGTHEGDEADEFLALHHTAYEPGRGKVRYRDTHKFPLY
jgi:hypothetical protein